MRIWLQICFGVIKVIKSFSKTFLWHYYKVFFIINNFFLKIVKNRILTYLLYWPQITMGWVLILRKVLLSKVWVLKNILSTHHIVISSIDQKLLNHLNKIVPHFSVMIRCTNTIFFFKNGIKSSNFARM